MNKLLGYYKTMRHNINYKENYYRNIMIILLAILLMDLVVLFIIW